MARYTPEELATGTVIHCLRDVRYNRWQGTVKEVEGDFAEVERKDGSTCRVRTNAIGNAYERRGDPRFLDDNAYRECLRTF